MTKTKPIEEVVITECCICRQQEGDGGKYYTPTAEARRVVYQTHTKISHGFCSECYILFEIATEGIE